MNALAYVRELHRRDRALALGGSLMLAGFVAAAAVAPFDDRIITGINPWIKPMKFFLSIGIFLWTMAWLMAEANPRYARSLAVVRWTMLLTMIGEIALIGLQAARGTTSHFNVGTPLDGAIFSAMGIMIVCNSLAAAAFIFLLRRDIPAARAAYLWGMRLGLTIFVVGSFQGFMMVANMAHTVPAPDGGPGLPFVNWSTTGGDLRVAHFIGLHALQAIPLSGFLLDRASASIPSLRARAVSLLATLWFAVMAAALALALAGRPLMAG
jgi:hypothetical protein